MGPGSGGGVSCWSVPTQGQGWEGTHGENRHFFTSHTWAWMSLTHLDVIAVPVPGDQPSVRVKPVPVPVQ